MPSPAPQKFPVKARTGKRPRTRTQLGQASFSAQQRQNNSGGGAPIAVSAHINHVQLQRPGHKLLFVRCRDSGCQFLVECGSTVTLWLQVGHRAMPGRSMLIFPTYRSTMRELKLSGQLFSHIFICVKRKVPIFGKNFLTKNRFVENYSGHFLTQIQMDLFIPAGNNKKQQASHINTSASQPAHEEYPVRFSQGHASKQQQLQ